ncbi:MAG: carboxypeptidase regulatory-like domain-containing protein, partial [Acidobacteriaceae bacterium]|nr:carboxypeptidase regulatory-like domain-containing protein [Acidobacteriaceae bacterium]
MTQKLTYLCSICVFLLGAFAVSSAQQTSITGQVTDPTGAAVPGATITITQSGTGESRTTQSSAAGLYDFPGIGVGNYDLKATAPGFQTFTKKGIVVDVGATVRADVPFAVGASNQTVTVQANALQVQSETSEVSNLITGEQVTQLSTNGRNVMSLTTLGTGVTSTLPSFNGVTAQGSSAEINFNGMRYDHNNWLIDGGEVYDRGSGGKLDVAI